MPTPSTYSALLPGVSSSVSSAHRNRGRLLLLLLLVGNLLLANRAAAQGCLSSFVLQGAAVQANGCYRLTSQGATSTSGAMWNAQPISLYNNFDFSFAINQCGAADGVVFVLQGAGTSVSNGDVGRTLGYYQGNGAFAHSVGVELDFYQNTEAPYNDPAYSHMMLALDGNPAAVQGPVAVSIGGCNTHVLRVSWNAATRLFTVQFDGTTMLSYTRDLVNTVFGGNSGVWFGFVGSTGGSTATQVICPGVLMATVAPPVIRVAGSTLLCPGEQTSLRVTNQPVGTTYQWTPATGLSSSSGAEVTAAPLATTTYRVLATTPGGCQSRDSVRISVLPRPTVVVGPGRVLCSGESAPLTATSLEAGTTHTWAPATGLSTSTGPAVVATPAVTTLYTVTTTGPAFCVRQDTVRVVVRPPLRLAVAAVRPTAHGESTLLMATSAVAGVTFAWTPTTGLSTNPGPTVTATPANTTTYTVTATAPNGCPEQAAIVAQPFLLPNVITPNGDHQNDTFRALVSLDPVTLQVFNRWGRLVFEQANYLDGWGSPAPAAGIYYYHLSTAQGQRWKGWVEVIR
jgi:gliding motility-associated-like protein